jgi:hypothetical protein
LVRITVATLLDAQLTISHAFKKNLIKLINSSHL